MPIQFPRYLVRGISGQSFTIGVKKKPAGSRTLSEDCSSLSEGSFVLVRRSEVGRKVPEKEDLEGRTRVL